MTVSESRRLPQENRVYTIRVVQSINAGQKDGKLPKRKVLNRKSIAGSWISTTTIASCQLHDKNNIQLFGIRRPDLMAVPPTQKWRSSPAQLLDGYISIITPNGTRRQALGCNIGLRNLLPVVRDVQLCHAQ
jgi:hypothetical protein